MLIRVRMGFGRCVYIIHTRTIFYTFTYTIYIMRCRQQTVTRIFIYHVLILILYRILNEL